MSRLVATHRWAVVLAGREGSRLRPLTRTLAGDARPKQFCSIRGDRPLLDATLRRAVLPAGPGPHASRGGRRSAGEPRDRTGGSVCAPELALPDLYAAFEPVRRCVGTVGEARTRGGLLQPGDDRLFQVRAGSTAGKPRRASREWRAMERSSTWTDHLAPFPGRPRMKKLPTCRDGPKISGLARGFMAPSHVAVPLSFRCSNNPFAGSHRGRLVVVAGRRRCAWRGGLCRSGSQCWRTSAGGCFRSRADDCEWISAR
jgi:hypothetical protein